MVAPLARLQCLFALRNLKFNPRSTLTICSALYFLMSMTGSPLGGVSVIPPDGKPWSAQLRHILILDSMPAGVTAIGAVCLFHVVYSERGSDAIAEILVAKS